MQILSNVWPLRQVWDAQNPNFFLKKHWARQRLLLSYLCRKMSRWPSSRGHYTKLILDQCNITFCTAKVRKFTRFQPNEEERDSSSNDDKLPQIHIHLKNVVSHVHLICRFYRVEHWRQALAPRVVKEGKPWPDWSIMQSSLTHCQPSIYSVMALIWQSDHLYNAELYYSPLLG